MTSMKDTHLLHHDDHPNGTSTPYQSPHETPFDHQDHHSHTRCSCKAYWRLCELLLTMTQIVIVTLDWHNTYNLHLHFWMIVSLSYRVLSLLFQWLCIEPCLRYLRRDRSAIISKEDYEHSGCCVNALLCWIIPWLWVFDNDIFLLIWTVLGTLLLIHAFHILDRPDGDVYDTIFECTMIGVLAISYLFWIISFTISVALFFCPQVFHHGLRQIGYAMSAPRGQRRINSILSINDSFMPGIRDSVSYSIRAPSRMNTSYVQSAPPTVPHYVSPKTNQPLPTQILRQFTRTVYTKKEAPLLTDSSTSINSNDINEQSQCHQHQHQHHHHHDPFTVDVTNQSSNSCSSSTPNPTSHRHPFHHSDDEHSVASAISPVSSPSAAAAAVHGHNHGLDKVGHLTHLLPQSYPRMVATGRSKSSFSSIRYWLSAKRSFEIENTPDTDTLTEQSPYREIIGNVHHHSTPTPRPTLGTDRASQSGDDADCHCFCLCLDHLSGFNNVPSPTVLRRLHVLTESKDIEPDDENHIFSKVVMPPLTAQVLSAWAPSTTTMAKSLKWFGGQREEERSIIRDVNLIVDAGDRYCSLCQHCYVEQETLIVLSCHHRFHEICGKQWFEHKSVCPICRKRMILKL